MDLLFLDWETTGFGKCRGVELAIAKNDEPVRIFRCRPAIPIEDQAAQVHGITNEMCKDLPTFQDLPEFAELKQIIENNVVVAHSAGFDCGVFEREGIATPIRICTKRVAAKMYPHQPSHKLQDLRAAFLADVEGEAHSAAGDVAVLRALFDLMMHDLENLGDDRDAALAKMAGWS